MLEPSSWLREFAPGYRYLSRGERRAISDFVLLWSVFEDQVLARNATVQGMLAEVDRWVELDRIDNARSDASWAHFVERLTTDGRVGYRFDGLRISNGAHAEIVRNALLDPARGSDPRERNRALAIIVHRIRNNLLHGEKWSYGLAQQEDNFRHCSRMLMMWTDASRGRGRRAAADDGRRPGAGAGAPNGVRVPLRRRTEAGGEAGRRHRAAEIDADAQPMLDLLPIVSRSEGSVALEGPGDADDSRSGLD